MSRYIVSPEARIDLDEISDYFAAINKVRCAVRTLQSVCIPD